MQTALAFSGKTLRSDFRQIAYKNIEMDCHPYLYYLISETPPFRSDMQWISWRVRESLIIRRFFDCAEFLAPVHTTSAGNGAFGKQLTIISAYLEYRNITRILLSGGIFLVMNEVSSKIDALNSMLHLSALEATLYCKRSFMFGLTLMSWIFRRCRWTLWIWLIAKQHGRKEYKYCGDSRLKHYRVNSMVREATRLIDEAWHL